MSKQGRIYYLDVARAIAIISITFNHAVNRTFNIYSGTISEYQTIPVLVTVLKSVLYIFSRIGVPFFLMITGALLLYRDYSGGYGKFLKKNWMQLLVTTEIWLTIMFWYLQLSPASVLRTEGLAVCLLRFVMTLLFIDPVTMGSMWYMPMILCVYLMIPIFSAALKSIPSKAFILPIAVVVLSDFLLPDLNLALSGIGMKYQLSTTLEAVNVFSMYAVYMLLGHFISQGLLDRMSRRGLLFSGLAAFLAAALFQFWLYSRVDGAVVAYEYMSLLLLVSSVFLFGYVKVSIKPERDNKLVVTLADISFGIYFVHICIMEGLTEVLDHFSLHSYFVRFALLEGVSFLGAVLIIQILRRNAWAAKNLFGIKRLGNKAGQA